MWTTTIFIISWTWISSYFVDKLCQWGFQLQQLSYQQTSATFKATDHHSSIHHRRENKGLSGSSVPPFLSFKLAATGIKENHSTTSQPPNRATLTFMSAHVKRKECKSEDPCGSAMNCETGGDVRTTHSVTWWFTAAGAPLYFSCAVHSLWHLYIFFQ